MRASEIVSERFQVLSFAAAGGMERDRFLRECRILATLEHPNVVRYVASGTHGGVPFLAMRWVEGETLTQRLRRGALAPDEVKTVLGAVGAGLAHAHAQGLVHRDLKPSNVILEGRAVDRAVVLDFGLARPVSGRTALTRSGMLVGTLGYMSPEQLRDPNAADARSDVFALGCMLFFCLTGRPAYADADAPVVMGRILFDPPPRPEGPGLPQDLVRLTLACLAKEPERRPRDARAFVEALWSDAASAASPGTLGGITHRERRRGSLVLIASTRSTSGTATQTAVDALCPPDVLEAVLEPYGARSVLLGDDIAVVLIPGRGPAVDQAAEAVRCAIALTEAVGEARATVVSGQAEADGVLGELFARAIALDREGEGGAGVRVDDLTGELLGERFRQVADGSARRIVEERRDHDRTRHVLGRPTPFVGREREIAELEGLVAESIAERAPRTALVLADAGMGKSRLRSELVARVRSAYADVRVLVVAGDPRTEGSPLTGARDALREALSLRPDEPTASRERVAAQLVTLDVPGAGSLVPFVCELASLEADNGGVWSGRIGRDDLLDRLRQAFLAVLTAEAKVRPLVVVLEDVHWIDTATLGFFGAMPRSQETALVVLAFGRRTFSAEGREQLGAVDLELGLQPLSPRAAERVVRAALPAIETETSRGLASRALGNPFFLEELIRSHAERPGTRPDTVVTALQGRVEALDAPARRFLRAASSIGEGFWLEAVARIVDVPWPELLGIARALEAAELVVMHESSRYPGTRELRFRHALVRDAAYAMLAAPDRRLAHGLVARWLEEVGERDARLLAEHWELGGEHGEAVAHWERAAEHALLAGELALAAELGRRAGGEGDGSGIGALVTAEALAVGDMAGARRKAERAVALLPAGPRWYRAQQLVVSTSLRLGDGDAARRAAQEMLAAPLPAEGVEERICLVQVLQGLAPMQDQDLLDRLLKRSDQPPDVPRDALLEAMRDVAGNLIDTTSASVGRTLRAFRRITAVYEQNALHRRSLPSAVNVAFQLNIIGAFRESEALLSSTRDRATSLRMDLAAFAAESNLAVARLGLGRPAEALAHARRAGAHFLRAQDTRMSGSCFAYQARALLAQGQLEEARRALAEALARFDDFPGHRAAALGILAAIELEAGGPVAALAAAREGFRLLSEAGGVRDDALLRLALLRSLVACGHVEDARVVAPVVFEHLRARYASLEDPELEAAFSSAPMHAEIAGIVAEVTGKRASWASGLEDR